MILGERNKIPIGAAIVIVTIGMLFSSCAKSGVEQPTGLSSYNMSAYNNNQLLTFNASAINHGDTILDIIGNWPTNIGKTYVLDIFHIKIYVKLKYLVGTYNLGTKPDAVYGAYPTGSNPIKFDFYYYTDRADTGTLRITSFDSATTSISGTFDFNGANSATGGNIYITNGSFTNVKIN